jgi:A/G-specific adenine glycosylase
MNSEWDSRKVRQFRERLLAWYRANRRALPWRSQPTPYRVWIAEIMLQQTRVQTALPYYERFLKRFPDVATLAAAAPVEILKHWAGLGYYRRAHHLSRAARIIMAESDGRFPETLERIRDLPGVGAYTAGAIYSIAYNRPEPVVDGNVRRVIRRLHSLADASESYFRRQAELCLARDEPADFNQALMELGALVCLPSRPLCRACPVRSLCQSGRAGRLPVSSGKVEPEPESLQIVLLLLDCGGQMAIARQPEGGFIPGEWGFPWKALASSRRPRTTASELARKILGFTPSLQSGPMLRHSITHRRILAHVFRAAVDPPAPALTGHDRYLWCARAKLDGYLISSLFRKSLVALPGGGRERRKSG